MKYPYPEMESITEPGVGRVYIRNEKFYPSITTILGGTMPQEKAKALKSWQNSLGKEKAAKVTKDAADNGTVIHTLTERFLKKEELVRPGDNFTTDNMAGFNALKLKLKKIDEVWGLEVPLYSDLIEVAGRCDCVGVYRGKPSIIDFKTSMRLKNDKAIEDYKLQITAYSIMHNELFGTEITDGVILMTSAGGFPQEFFVDLTKYVEPLVKRIDEFYQKLKG
jgi:genome maintenance exonuclease 1